jgi:acyl carrier protein
MLNRNALIDLFEKAATEIAERDISNLQESTEISALGIDSLALLELIGAMERQLGIHLPDDQLVGLTTVRELIDLVELRHAAGARGGQPHA